MLQGSLGVSAPGHSPDSFCSHATSILSVVGGFTSLEFQPSTKCQLCFPHQIISLQHPTPKPYLWLIRRSFHSEQSCYFKCRIRGRKCRKSDFLSVSATVTGTLEKTKFFGKPRRAARVNVGYGTANPDERGNICIRTSGDLVFVVFPNQSAHITATTAHYPSETRQKASECQRGRRRNRVTATARPGTEHGLMCPRGDKPTADPLPLPDANWYPSVRDRHNLYSAFGRFVNERQH